MGRPRLDNPKLNTRVDRALWERAREVATQRRLEASDREIVEAALCLFLLSPVKAIAINDARTKADR